MVPEEISDERFRQVLQACPISVRELADKLSVSRPTVERWLMGKNLPHPTIRKVIVDYVKSLGEVGSTPTADRWYGTSSKTPEARFDSAK